MKIASVLDPREGRLRRIWLLAVALVVATGTLTAAANGATISSPDWYIDLNDAGYSDWMIQTFPGQLDHENLSGEWAAAISYDGISTPGGVSMWLTPWFICPYFTTNSTFSTEIPLTTWDDPANPTTGNDTGYSKISNGVVDIEISYTMHDTGTGVAAGLRPGGAGLTPPVMSGRYVLEVTYVVTNISGEALTNVRFFQFLHAHPNDDYGPNNYGVYDPTHYATGAFQEYRYDITQYGASIWNPPGSDITGFSSADPPAAWGIGDFSGHEEEPTTGLHRDVYNDTLPMTTSGGPAEIAGAMKWEYGIVQPGESFSKSVLLYNGYTWVEIPPPHIAVPLDVKPQSCPNPFNTKSKGVLPVAVLGTEDFDVPTIDPATIRLTREGYEDSVSPLRWSYEDVATPFEGELCECHELGPDGYVDLTLKFDIQEVKETLDLEAEADNTIPLLITGNLKEEAGGTPIEGSDCVWVLKTGKK